MSLRILLFLLIIIPVGFLAAKPCTGEDDCKVCVNCTECKYCTPEHHCNVWEEYNAKIKRESEAPLPEQPTNWLGVVAFVCISAYLIWQFFFNNPKIKPTAEVVQPKNPEPTPAIVDPEEERRIEEQFNRDITVAIRQMEEEEKNQPPLNPNDEAPLRALESMLRLRASLWRIGPHKHIGEATVRMFQRITANRPWPSALERRVGELLERDLKANPPPE